MLNRVHCFSFIIKYVWLKGFMTKTQLTGYGCLPAVLAAVWDQTKT